MARRRKNKKPVELPLVYVEWVDHNASGAWVETIDHVPSLCVSVGWLAKEDRRGITLSGSRAIDGVKMFGNTQYILKNCITVRKKGHVG